MGILKFKGSLIRFDKRGFIFKEFKIRKNNISKFSALKISIPKLRLTPPKIKFSPPNINLLSKPPQKRIMIRHKENQSSAEDFFYKTNKMSRLDKFEDLLETNTNTNSPTHKHITRWKKNPKNSDIEGVDTTNIPKAQSLQPKTQSFKKRIAMEYKKGYGDVKSFTTHDKSYIDSISDEALFEWEEVKTERINLDEL